MKHTLYVIMLIIVIMSYLTGGCRKKPETNTVEDLEQFDTDNANNYRYLFRERIQEEERQKNRNRRDWK